MNNMAMCNYVVSVVGMLIGGSIMGASSQFPMEFTVNGPGPGFWPFTLGCALLVAAVVLLGYTFMKKQELAQEPVALSGPANKRVYCLMAIVAIFTGLINLLGFYPAAALLIPAIMKLMDYHKKTVILAVTLGTLTFIYLVFTMILRTQMPESIFM